MNGAAGEQRLYYEATDELARLRKALDHLAESGLPAPFLIEYAERLRSLRVEMEHQFLPPQRRPPAVLDRLVAAGRAVPPRELHAPVAPPPVLGDPRVSVADVVAAAREDERW
ncbi:hypothetical protein GCM10012275_64790 [Longimycelium tulufanense]|uniref:Uncharacterized protein n=1 Tax=Longimycelium tulufanense TaxID=907463 RepID=A0A8J3FXC1_9PSEU|nr:hypothetical protein [Longimycelium tulufanense]GGM85063.1 hypothetical protein GCM10012275_64790 [Longimycelium tulufanense]